jgi:hypothetical protein
MSTTNRPPHDLLAALRARLNARAAGWWRVGEGRLEQVAFVAAGDMPEAVASAFAEATRSVPLDQTGLGIVSAAVMGEVTVSRARDLPDDSGSGLWLRRFEAERSVAVPVRDLSGRVSRVVSVALAASPDDDASVAQTIREEAAVW